MKRICKLILVLLISCAIFTITGCEFLDEFLDAIEEVIEDKPVHSHVYDKEVIDNKYLVSVANCENKAVYYYSCECGEKGTETFEYGETLGHDYSEYVSDNNATCLTDGTKRRTCSRCNKLDIAIDFNTKGHHFDLKSDRFIKTVGNCLIKQVYYYECSICHESAQAFDETKTYFGDYVHEFNCEIDSDTYLNELGDCYNKTSYYKSCSCGASSKEYKGEVFYTSFIHTCDNEVINDNYLYILGNCTTKSKYYKSCDCGLYHSDITFDGDYIHTIGENSHDKYLVSCKNCVHGDVYYKSCECGLKSSLETFEIEEVYGEHSWSEYVNDNNRTCQSGGTKTRTCSICNEKDTIDTGDNPLNHSYDKNFVESPEHLYIEKGCGEYNIYWESCKWCGLNGTSKGYDQNSLDPDGNQGTGGNLFLAKSPNGHKFVLETVSDDSKVPSLLGGDACCTHGELYYLSCECGEHSSDLNETFSVGSNVHDFTHVNICNENKAGDATCKHGIEYYYECSNCHEVGINTFYDGDPVSHSYERKNVCNDCLKYGNTYYYSCLWCDNVSDTLTFEYDPKEDQYDIIDYYQDITISSNDYSLEYWSSSSELVEILRKYIRNGYTAISYGASWELNKLAEQSIYDYEMCDVVYSENNVSKSADGNLVNKEHAYCASLMTGSSTGNATGMLGRATDFHNLFASDASGNKTRGNKNFGQVTSTSLTGGYYQTGKANGESESVFEPGDYDKGRLARAILYMVLMYYTTDYDSVNKVTMGPLSIQDGYVTYKQGDCKFSIGHMSDIIRWAQDYPVDELEYQHNLVVYYYKADGTTAQGNRNPFVDYPDLVDYIWGDKQNESGSLLYLEPTSHKLGFTDDNKSNVKNYAIYTAKRSYEAYVSSYNNDDKSTFTLNDLQVVKVYYEFDTTTCQYKVSNPISTSNYTVFIYVNDSWIQVSSSYKFTKDGTYKIKVVAGLDEIIYEVGVITDPFDYIKYSGEIPSSSSFDGKTNLGENYDFIIGSKTWTFNYQTAYVNGSNKYFGTQFGNVEDTTKNKYSCDLLTITSASSFTNVKGVYFRGGVTSSGTGNPILKIYVGETLVTTYEMIYKNNVTALDCYFELPETMSGKVKFEITNSSTKAFFVKEIGVDY